METKDLNKGFKSGSAIITDFVVLEVLGLLEGKRPLSERNFLSLSTLLESFILYDNLFYLGNFDRLPSEISDQSFIKDLNNMSLSLKNSNESLDDSFKNLHDALALQFSLRARAYCSLIESDGTIGGLSALIDDVSEGESYIWLQRTMYASLMAISCAGDLPSKECCDLIKKTPDQIAILREIDLVVTGETGISKTIGIPVFSDPILQNFRIDLEVSFFSKIEQLYKVVCETWERNIKDLYAKYLRMRFKDIPPITAIILSRCNKREDIISKAIELREELADLRKLWVKHEAFIRGASTLAESFEEMRAFEDANRVLSEKISGSKRTEKQLFGTIWDIVKSSSVDGMIIEALDKIYKYDKTRNIKSWVQAFTDIYKKASNIGKLEYPKLCKNVFEEEFNKELTKNFIDIADRSKGIFPKLKDTDVFNYDLEEFLFEDYSDEFKAYENEFDDDDWLYD